MHKDKDYTTVVNELELSVGWDKEVLENLSITDKMLINSVIKVVKYKIGLVDISKKAYLVWIKPATKAVVLADNVADVMDKLNKKGIFESDYKIVDSKGYKVVY